MPFIDTLSQIFDTRVFCAWY